MPQGTDICVRRCTSALALMPLQAQLLQMHELSSAEELVDWLETRNKYLAAREVNASAFPQLPRPSRQGLPHYP